MPVDLLGQEPDTRDTAGGIRHVEESFKCSSRHVESEFRYWRSV